MYCPQCGQQQVSGDARFCSRCGFQLSAVTGLLATGGVLSTASMPNELRIASPRRKGALAGGKLVLLSVFLIPMLALLQGFLSINLDLPLLGVALLLGGILRLLYALIFQEGVARQPALSASSAYAVPAVSQQRMGAGAVRGSELPPHSSIPVPTFMPPRNTGELTPPSITENTTRLLDEQTRQK